MAVLIAWNFCSGVHGHTNGHGLGNWPPDSTAYPINFVCNALCNPATGFADFKFRGCRAFQIESHIKPIWLTGGSFVCFNFSIF